VASEILDHLERVMDRLEDVANKIHGIHDRARLSADAALEHTPVQ
jgi:hypothetical protein